MIACPRAFLITTPEKLGITGSLNVRRRVLGETAALPWAGGLAVVSLGCAMADEPRPIDKITAASVAVRIMTAGLSYSNSNRTKTITPLASVKVDLLACIKSYSGRMRV